MIATVTGPDMAPVSFPLYRDLNFDFWDGGLDSIPAGSSRSFKVEAITAGQVVIYRGGAEDVLIAPGATAAVQIRAENGPPPVQGPSHRQGRAGGRRRARGCARVRPD